MGEVMAEATARKRPSRAKVAAPAPAEGDEADVTLRTRVYTNDGANVDVRERWTTVVRHLDEDREKNRVTTRLSTSPQKRVAIAIAEVSRVEELAR